ncbi:Dynactin subunit 6 [Mactra antiquata]
MANQKSSIKIAPGAVVCDESELHGDITIGTRTVIHPKARIIADAGPIIIGENNIFEELCCVINKAPENSTPGSTQAVMIIGNNNVFEVGCNVEAVKIGDNNIVEAKASVGREVNLTSGCIIGAACSVTCSEELSDNAVIYGANCERRIQKERPPAQTLQIDFLTKILPNYHYLRKPAKQSTPQKS